MKENKIDSSLNNIHRKSKENNLKENARKDWLNKVQPSSSKLDPHDKQPKIQLHSNGSKKSSFKEMQKHGANEKQL